MRATESPHETRFGTLPSGNSRFVSAAFSKLDPAIDATRQLEERGYARDRVSVFMATETRDQLIETHPRYGEIENDAVMVDEVELTKQSKAAEGAGTGGAIGGAIGAGAAAVAAIGTTIVIPPLGIAIAGPVAALLAGLGAGAAAGGIVGALVGAGMTEYRAKRFEKLMKDGHVIVGVIAETEPERQDIVEILESEGGEVVAREEAD